MKHLRTWGCLPVAALLLLAGCSSNPEWVTVSKDTTGLTSTTTTTAQPRVQWKNRPADQIAPGFQITVSGAEDAKLNGTFPVAFDGTIKLPYSQQVNAAGMTTEELRGEINRIYQQFLKSPHVKVAIAKKEYLVDVRGLVKKPGIYAVKNTSSLDELIALAEGLQENTNQQSLAQYAQISQLGVTNYIRLRDYFSGTPGLIPSWEGGESVFFQSERGGSAAAKRTERNYVQMLGQVKAPGEYPYDGSDFFSYVVKAGGPTDRADMYNIALIRQEGSETKAITFAVDDAEFIPTLRSGDVIIVNADNPSPNEKGARIVGGYTGIISSLATIALLFAAI